MVCSVEHVQVGQLLGAELGLGKHALHYLDEKRVLAFYGYSVGFLHQVSGGEATLAAGITRVTEILALLHLAAVQNYLVGVDDYHVVSAIHVRRIVGLVLATKNLGYLRAEAAKYHVCRIDEYPLLLYR